MNWTLYIAQLLLGFVISTLVLWLCSQTVKTARSDLKTAAIYNAIMLVIGLIYLGISSLLMMLEVESIAVILPIALVLIAGSFILLMRLYSISFLAALWLAVAMSVVQTGLNKITDLIFT